jgi:hypothetical protein
MVPGQRAPPKFSLWFMCQARRRTNEMIRLRSVEDLAPLPTALVMQLL